MARIREPRTVLELQEPRTVLELCIARAGGSWRAVPKGMRVSQFMIEWLILSELEGRAITLPEYRRFYKKPERSAYRHLSEFRELFGEKSDGFSDPQPMVDLLAPQLPSAWVDRIGRVRRLRGSGERKAGLRGLEITELLRLPVAL